MITRYSSYLFMLTTLVPGIPVLAIVVRYNLQSSGLCSRIGATFWGVIAPWVIALFLYNTPYFVKVLAARPYASQTSCICSCSTLLTRPPPRHCLQISHARPSSVRLQMLNWISILLMGFVNFARAPLLLATALVRYPAAGGATKPSDADADDAAASCGGAAAAAAAGAAGGGGGDDDEGYSPYSYRPPPTPPAATGGGSAARCRRPPRPSACRRRPPRATAPSA